MIHVTCAIIQHEGKILICQRSARMNLPLKWEFSRGKIEPGESREGCLAREIREELGITVRIDQPLTAVTHQDGDFVLTLYPFVCALAGGTLHPTEHEQAVSARPTTCLISERFSYNSVDRGLSGFYG